MTHNDDNNTLYDDNNTLIPVTVGATYAIREHVEGLTPLQTSLRDAGTHLELTRDDGDNVPLFRIMSGPYTGNELYVATMNVRRVDGAITEPSTHGSPLTAEEERERAAIELDALHGEALAEQAVRLQNTIDNLNGKVRDTEARLDNAEEALRDSRNQHRADIDRIGARLLELADEHAWCETFDEEIDDANRVLTFPLPRRQREFEVEWDETYTVTIRRTVTVECVNEDEAKDMAKENHVGEWHDNLAQQVIDEVRSGNFEWNDDTDETNDTMRAERI